MGGELDAAAGQGGFVLREAVAAVAVVVQDGIEVGEQVDIHMRVAGVVLPAGDECGAIAEILGLEQLDGVQVAMQDVFAGDQPFHVVDDQVEVGQRRRAGLDRIDRRRL